MISPRNWDLLVRRARWLLEHADEVSARESIVGLKPCLRLWHYPVRGAHLSWMLLYDGARDPGRRCSVVREIRWDRSADDARLRKPTAGLRYGVRLDPTCRIRDARVAEEDVDSILGAASEFIGRPAPSCDPDEEEDRFGIEGFGAVLHLRHEWVSVRVAESDALVRWAGRIRKLLMGYLKARAEM